MLKKVINYTDYDGNQKSGTFYFNLTETELREMKRSPLYEMQKIIDRIETMENPDKELTYEEKDAYQEKLGEILRSIVIQSYGIKSPDGERFIKRSGERRYGAGEEFTETMAYDALYSEMISDISNVVKFIREIVPANMRSGIDDEITNYQAKTGEVISIDK